MVAAARLTVCGGRVWRGVRLRCRLAGREVPLMDGGGTDGFQLFMRRGGYICETEGENLFSG